MGLTPVSEMEIMSHEAQKTYLRTRKVPIWVEYYIDNIVSEMTEDEFWTRYELERKTGSEKEWYIEELERIQQKRKEIQQQEEERLDRFCKLLCSDDRKLRNRSRNLRG